LRKYQRAGDNWNDLIKEDELGEDVTRMVYVRAPSEVLRRALERKSSFSVVRKTI
jgi:hypothetical protein